MAETRYEAVIMNLTAVKVEFIQVDGGDRNFLRTLQPGHSFTYSVLDGGTYGHLEVRPNHPGGFIHGFSDISSDDLHNYSKISVAYDPTREKFYLDKEHRRAEASVVSAVLSRTYSGISGGVLSALSRASSLISRVPSFNLREIRSLDPTKTPRMAIRLGMAIPRMAIRLS